MNEDTKLPEDDRDRALAQRIGQRLAAGTRLHGSEEEGDPFYEALLAYKQQSEREAVPGDAGIRMWDAIDARLGADRPAERRGRLRLVHAPTWLAVAAVVLVLVAVGWWLWPSATAPVLLAAAEQTTTTYTTPDGSVVTLRPHSELYALNEAETHLRLTGEAYFDVVRDTTRTFRVDVNQARVSVLGTAFDLSGWGAATVVYLVEGRVRFEHRPSNEAVVLAPGQRAVVGADGALSPPVDAPEDEYLDWMQGAIQFEQRPLRHVLAELTQHYGITFDVPSALLDETLSGRFLLGDPDRSLGDLSVVLGGRFVPVDEDTYRYVAQ